jgi:hypothetical protein
MNSSVTSGEQLESIHVSRQRAQAAHDLIHHYNQFSKGDTQELDALRKDGGKAGRRQVAIILRRLTTVAKEVDLPDAEQVGARQINEIFRINYCHRLEGGSRSIANNSKTTCFAFSTNRIARVTRI